MAADRTAYGARQAQLLRALQRGDGYPDGFAGPRADAAGLSLRRKRANAVRAAWPALALALGPRLGSDFEAFARANDPPAFGHGLTDGLAFAAGLDPGGLDDDVRAELLLARALVRRDGAGEWRPRRGPFAGAARLRARQRLLIVIRLPGIGRRHVSVALGARARRSSAET